MIYILPIFYVLLSYGFLFLVYFFPHIAELKYILFFLLFLIGVANLIIVVTVGRKWPRKAMLNCALIIKYGLVPFYLIGGGIIFGALIATFFPLPFMVFFGIITAILACLGYVILLGSAPYAIAYIISACKDGVHSKPMAVLCGICQFFFLFDVISIIVLTLKEHHLRKTTIILCCLLALLILSFILFAILILTL